MVESSVVSGVGDGVGPDVCEVEVVVDEGVVDEGVEGIGGRAV